MRADALPAALGSAVERLRALPADLDPAAAAAILRAADPPRATGALAASGRVVESAVVYGGGTVDYAAPVHYANPFLDRAVDAAMDAVLALAEDRLADAITL